MRRSVFPWAAAVLAVLAASTLPASAAEAAKPTAVVSMGDSYISGEAGRWQGNSISPLPGHDGTDRACFPFGSAVCSVDKSRVYVGGSNADGCHRSDVAEILSGSIPVTDRVNIACSGAVTKNLFRAASGGEGQNGEAAQADQLLGVARSHDVKLIVVSIGGNDLGFASIVSDCLAAYEAKQGPCGPKEKTAVDAKVPMARGQVEKVVDEIRAVMSAAGYSAGGYRLVLQTYPSVIPRAAEVRYGENDPRRTTDGCPFYDDDMTGSRDTLGPEIGQMVKDAAAAKGVETLDLIDLLQGHEICAKTDREATPTDHPTPAESEWGRFVGASTVAEGDLQEAFHPNAYAQRALGACLAGVYARAPGSFECSSAAGRAPADVTLRAVPFGHPGAGGAAPLHLRAHRVHRKRRGVVCERFTARASGHAVAGAHVRFAGHRRKTGGKGTTTICTHIRRGPHRALAHHAGFKPARLIVHVPRHHPRT